MKKKYFETCSCNPANGGNGICGCTLGNNEIDEYSGYTSFVTATTLWRWTSPGRINVIEFSDRIEFIYKETSMLNYSVSPPPKPEERVFKLFFPVWMENGISQTGSTGRSFHRKERLMNSKWIM